MWTTYVAYDLRHGGLVLSDRELARSSEILILSYQTIARKCRTLCVIHRHNFRRHNSFPPNHHRLSPMLRLGLFASARPLFVPVSSRTTPHVFCLRSFGSTARPRILEALRNRPPNFITKPFRQASRGVVDSAVVSRPSQTESWRRYAVTAVR